MIPATGGGEGIRSLAWGLVRRTRGGDQQAEVGGADVGVEVQVSPWRPLAPMGHEKPHVLTTDLPIEIQIPGAAAFGHGITVEVVPVQTLPGWIGPVFSSWIPSPGRGCRQTSGVLNVRVVALVGVNELGMLRRSTRGSFKR